MTHLTFYFDPLCPWAWLTSLWAREVRDQGAAEVEWKFFSLAAINELDPFRYSALRVCALARREGGNDAVDRAYLALGRMYHEARHRPETEEELAKLSRQHLEDVGLAPELVSRALADSSTLDNVLTEHQNSVDRLHAFGVPWVLVDGQEPGFFGPVINEYLRGEKARELLDHYVWLANQPYLFEIKRTERALPKLQGLSAAFTTGARAAE
jgi:protein-disulfide isomerase-like protein with CxxC motif